MISNIFIIALRREELNPWKIFDMIAHKLLLSKFKYNRIRGTAFELLSSYLKNHKEAVRIDAVISSLEYDSMQLHRVQC